MESENAEEESKESIDTRFSSEYGKGVNLYETQGFRLLQLINNIEKIIEYYDQLDSEEINQILQRLEMAYEIVHKFNMNTERRFELYEKENLRANNNKVPVLIKHEIQSMKMYFILLTKLYETPKEDLSKQEVAEMIIAFSSKVLKAFSSNYNKMLHKGVKNSNQLSTGNKALESKKLREEIEEMKRILVSVSGDISESVLRTLLNLSKSDLKAHVKDLTPLLIDCTICDQLEFNLRLKEALKNMFKILIDESH